MNLTTSTTTANTINSLPTKNRVDPQTRHRQFSSSTTASSSSVAPRPQEEEEDHVESPQDFKQQRPSIPVQSSAAVTYVPPQKQHQRVWMPNSSVEPLYWNDDIVSRSSIDDDNDLYLYGQSDNGLTLPGGGSRHDNSNSNSNNNSYNQQRRQTKHSQLESLLERIERQEVDGGRMRARQYGVLHEDPTVYV